jgi:programmed cell death 6-interacting protein
VLFSLGAICSPIALAADRVSDVGIRTACGAFTVHRESRLAARPSLPGPPPSNVTPDCAGMLEELMLEQVQEYFFEHCNAPTLRTRWNICVKCYSLDQ